jgi:hypothetical protein
VLGLGWMTRIHPLTLLLGTAVLSAGCSSEPTGQQSFEICGGRLTVRTPFLAYNFGQRFGVTDGARVIEVVPPRDGNDQPPMLLGQVVWGLDDFDVNASAESMSSDGTTINLAILETKSGSCTVSVFLSIGRSSELALPNTGYLWSVAFVGDR